ncbi:glycosyltransferase family 2 protein [Alphaproteobacteria bacterium]|nr:glycosyltransferase family 2 protein [Alphaproteobacteria bacterium]
MNQIKNLISIGMPIRNGINFINEALDSIQNQTVKNLEIIISDNQSDDGTSDYLKVLAKKDKRIKYYLQEKKISVFENFKFVLSKANGNYFMWAAHDDTRSKNYIEILKKGLEKNPDSILAFGDVYRTSIGDKIGSKIDFDFDTTNQNKFLRLKKLSFIQCFYLYGLWRTDVIKNVPYDICTWWPDLPMMLSAACKGYFIYVPGTRFNYLEINKSSLERIKYQEYKDQFNLLGGVLYLLKSCFTSCKKSGGVLIGCYVFFLVLSKQFINFPIYILNRFKNRTVNND